jgi:hypothetical protein
MNSEKCMAALVEIWHVSDAEIPIHEFLLMSKDEYHKWLKGEMTDEVAYELYTSRSNN